ncbi:MAG TPA: polyprenyl synthetase family protein [Clostridiaceae bacterium]|nr:polyprenyl synthetase family protein [Clostridiaceae bacterium]
MIDCKTDTSMICLSYDQALAETRQLIADTLIQAPPVIRPYTSFLARGSGKMLRASGVLLCALDGDLAIHPDAVRMAAAIEIIHLASLVHDDVIDNAGLRRGRPTLNRQAGNKKAVICGDYLLSRSFKIVSRIPDPQGYLNVKFADYIGSLCLGELNQLINNSNFHMTPLSYFRIIKGKTAALFEASFLAGALTGGVPESELGTYCRLGHTIGMIFQLTDDCMDFEAGEDEAGKNTHSDYEQNVITLPLIFAMKSDPEFKAELLAAEEGGNKLSRRQINRQVIGARGLQKTRRVVWKYGEKALRMMDQLELSEEKRCQLETLLQKAMRQA